MPEYIEREAALKGIDTAIGEFARHGEVVRFIGDCRASVIYAPTADVAEVRHGEWIPIEYDGYADGNPAWDLWECSECQEEHRGDEDTLTPSCPNCGAKMDGKGEGE